VLLASSLALAPTGAARWDAALFVPTIISFALVGAFLASRRSNPIAWLFLSIGIGGAIGQAAEKYAASGAADTAVAGEARARDEEGHRRLFEDFLREFEAEGLA